MNRFSGLLYKIACWSAGITFSWASAVHGAPMDISVVDGDVRSVLLSAARMGGFNVVLDDSVGGTVTLSLQGVEPEEALQLVAGAGNYVLERMGNSFVITARNKAEGLCGSHVFRLRYGNPGELRDAVILSLGKAGNSPQKSNTEGEENASNIGKRDAGETCVTIDPSTNSLIFYGTAAEAMEVDRLLHRLDVPAQQVSLEAKVVAIDKAAAKDLGVQWMWSTLPQYPRRQESYHSRRQKVTGTDGTSRVDYVDIPTVEMERKGQTDGMGGVVQFGRGPEGIPFEFYYGAKINALISDGRAKMLSRPNITTIQGHEAVINIGGEVPVPTVAVTNSTTTTSIQYRQAGIILRYTPRVNAEGYITAEVHTEVSSPLYVDSLKAYRFQKRSADTTVRLKDGETMVIGGLIGSEESRSLSKIPFLGDLPILGAFFRNVKNSKTDSELMIFLTAHVLEDHAGSTGTAEGGQYGNQDSHSG